MILPFILLIIIFHLWGTKKNRRKAKAWAQAHAPVLQNEFAAVGFGGVSPPDNAGWVHADRSAFQVSSSELVSPDSILRENSPQEFASYATGRQNVAFLDLTLKLVKRYNPVIFLMDHILSIFFESWPAPVERVEAVAYAFDGKEKELVPVPAGDTGALKVQNSSYDPFIWAVVHKNTMRKLRQDRYDVSMTQTKDNAKLPSWVTVMSESAEVTDTLLTPELIKAIEQADDAFEYLIISDQPIEKPAKYVTVLS